MHTNKEIIKELQKLKSVKPDGVFVAKNREKLFTFLMNESKSKREEKVIYIAKTKNLWYDFNAKLFYKLARPAGIFLLILGILTGGGAGISYASYNSVPGDVFYQVKLTIEKAQISLKSKEEDKVKLEVEFAGRRIDELNKVKVKELAENKKAPENKKIALDNFKKNIETAQGRLEKIKGKDFTAETMEVVNLVEAKTVEYSIALKNISAPEQLVKSEEEEEEDNNEEKNESVEELPADINNKNKESNSEIKNEDDANIDTVASTTEETAVGTETEEAEASQDSEIATTTDEVELPATATQKEIEEDKFLEYNEGKNNNEIDEVFKEAMEVSENLGIKAVDIIIEKQNNGEIALPQDEIAKKVKNKAETVKNKVDDLKEKVDLVNKKSETGTSTAQVIKNDSEENNVAKDNQEKEDLAIKKAETATEITKMNNALDAVDELLEKGDIASAFDKVKEANELKKNVEIKMEQAKEGVLEIPKTTEILIEHKN